MDVYAGGNIGEASTYAGPLGVGVKGPGAEAKCKAGKDGVNVAAGAEVVSGNVQLGAVNVGAGVGTQGKLVAGKDELDFFRSDLNGSMHGNRRHSWCGGA